MCQSARPSQCSSRWARSAGISVSRSRRYPGSVAGTCQPKRCSVPSGVLTSIAGVCRAPHWVNRCAISMPVKPSSRQIPSHRSRRVKSSAYPSSSSRIPTSCTKGRVCPSAVSSGGVQVGVSTEVTSISRAEARKVRISSQCSSENTSTS